MQKRITSIAIMLILLVTAIGIAPAPAEAASKTPYMTSSTCYGQPKEKVGSYYIWVEYSEKSDTYKLKRAKSLKGKSKTLKTLTSRNKYMEDTIVTNGSTIYYAVTSMDNGSAVIYRTNVKGAKAKKIKTVKSIGGLGLAGYYNGKLYYNVFVQGSGRIDLYAYQIAKKKAKRVKKDFMIWSGYGKYMTGVAALKSQGPSYPHFLYNAKTGKRKKLPKTGESVVYGNAVYYAIYAKDASSITIKKSNLKGKSVKKIKTIKNASITYFGRKAAYFEMWDSGKMKKLVYKTKKLTAVKS
ncbi:hypothetical protein LI177_12960 [bacterium 210820-DFI.6.37]|nr:hypothetical protein [bacterium 210820-DFI.6.37]